MTIDSLRDSQAVPLHAPSQEAQATRPQAAQIGAEQATTPLPTAQATTPSPAEQATTPPFNIVLIEPEIPQNTGNIARTCAITGAVLHLVEPMGFRLSSKQLSRSGCDYWNDVEIVRWPSAQAFFQAHGADELHLFTGRTNRRMENVTYNPGCFLLFGRESRGIDPAYLDRYQESCVRIPMRSNQRSLNLSNAVAIASYEALRQNEYPGLE